MPTLLKVQQVLPETELEDDDREPECCRRDEEIEQPPDTHGQQHAAEHAEEVDEGQAKHEGEDERQPAVDLGRQSYDAVSPVTEACKVVSPRAAGQRTSRTSHTEVGGLRGVDGDPEHDLGHRAGASHRPDRPSCATLVRRRDGRRRWRDAPR